MNTEKTVLAGAEIADLQRKLAEFKPSTNKGFEIQDRALMYLIVADKPERKALIDLTLC